MEVEITGFYTLAPTVFSVSETPRILSILSIISTSGVLIEPNSKQGLDFFSEIKTAAYFPQQIPRLEAADEALKDAQRFVPEASKRVRRQLADVLAEANRQVSEVKDLLNRIPSE